MVGRLQGHDRTRKETKDALVSPSSVKRRIRFRSHALKSSILPLRIRDLERLLDLVHETVRDLDHPAQLPVHVRRVEPPEQLVLLARPHRFLDWLASMDDRVHQDAAQLRHCVSKVAAGPVLRGPWAVKSFRSDLVNKGRNLARSTALLTSAHALLYASSDCVCCGADVVCCGFLVLGGLTARERDACGRLWLRRISDLFIVPGQLSRSCRRSRRSGRMWFFFTGNHKTEMRSSTPVRCWHC